MRYMDGKIGRSFTNAEIHKHLGGLRAECPLTPIGTFANIRFRPKTDIRMALIAGPLAPPNRQASWQNRGPLFTSGFVICRSRGNSSKLRSAASYRSGAKPDSPPVPFEVNAKAISQAIDRSVDCEKPSAADG